MPFSDSSLPFINPATINTGKQDPSKVPFSTIVDYVTNRNRTPKKRMLQIHGSPICFPNNFSSPLRFSQDDINEKRNTLTSTSKKQEELVSKTDKSTLPKLQPLFSMTATMKYEQKSKKNKLKSRLAQALLDDFRQNVKTIKSIMNPESSSMVVESEKKAANSRHGIKEEQVHIFTPFSGAHSKRAKEITLRVTGNSCPQTFNNAMNMKRKLKSEQHQRPTFSKDYF
ncbi:uncharacterized protein LOC130454491 [Monodelphis domestica]|uniref:uncharacterized protein LOC130454491 n=1 Tax=Monodelphis domestica TaxID=13616 RepID=UPI0024E233CD|nr:uncharacterized protein LOC130454491 [Monodelphis domestica]